MTQTIDLRKKNTPLEVPKPPEELESAIESVIDHEPEATIPPGSTEESNIRWEAHRSPPPPEGRVTYMTTLLITGAILIAYFTHDILFTSILALSAIVLNLNKSKPRKKSEITIHATGVSIDDQRHHYADIKSFWIEYQPNQKELSLEFKKGYAPNLSVPLEEADPLAIRRAMLAYVPEKEHEQSLLDHIVRLIGI